MPNSNLPTHQSLDGDGLLDIIVRNDKEVYGDAGEDDGTADAGLHRRGNHGDQGDEDGAQHVNGREDQVDLQGRGYNPAYSLKDSSDVVRWLVDLDGSLPLRVFPAEVGQAEHCQPDGELGGCGQGGVDDGKRWLYS